MHPDIYVSTASVRAPRDLRGVLGRLRAVGIDRIELSAPHPHCPDAELLDLLFEHSASGADFILHNYFPAPAHEVVLNLASTREDIREQTRALVASAIAVADTIGAPLYACHAGYDAYAVCLDDGCFRFTELDAAEAKQAREQMHSSISWALDLEPVRSGRVRFALENLFPPPPPEPNHCFACTPEEIDELLRCFDGLGLLLDLGHLDVAANWMGFDRDAALDRLLADHAARVFEVHLSGNDRKLDRHWPLAPSDWQLEALTRICTHSGAEPVVTVEARDLSDAECAQQRDLVRSHLGGER